MSPPSLEFSETSAQDTRTDVTNVQDMPGAGRGLVTRKMIKAGELILQEGAQMVLEAEDIEEQNISNKLKTLKPEDREKFASLQGKTGAVVSPHCDRFTTNAVSIDNKQYGLFLTLAMLNHSCVPNAGKMLIQLCALWWRI